MNQENKQAIGNQNTGVAIGSNIDQNITIINLGPLQNLPPTELRSQIADHKLVDELVRMLADHNSFFHNVHRPLESGFHVTDYIDLRILATNSAIAAAFGKGVTRLVNPSQFDLIVGLDPIALAVARSTSDFLIKPCSYFLSLNSKPRTIENKLPKFYGTRVLLITDVVATAETIRSTIDILQGRGFTIAGVVAIVVRGGTQPPDLKDLNVKFHWLLSYPFQNYQPNKCPACLEGKVFF